MVNIDMEKLSVFDVIGPNMIGPSSSHTAGALKIARLAAEQVPGSIVQATFFLYGSFAATYRGHGTDRALLAGLLGFKADDIRIKNAYKHAEDAGLKYSFIAAPLKEEMHPNTVDLVLFNDNREMYVITGVSEGGGIARIIHTNTKKDDRFGFW